MKVWHVTFADILDAIGTPLVEISILNVSVTETSSRQTDECWKLVSQVISSIELILKQTVETIVPQKAIILRVPTVTIALLTMAPVAMAPYT